MAQMRGRAPWPPWTPGTVGPTPGTVAREEMQSVRFWLEGSCNRAHLADLLAPQSLHAGRGALGVLDFGGAVPVVSLDARGVLPARRRPRPSVAAVS